MDFIFGILVGVCGTLVGLGLIVAFVAFYTNKESAKIERANPLADPSKPARTTFYAGRTLNGEKA